MENPSKFRITDNVFVLNDLCVEDEPEVSLGINHPVCGDLYFFEPGSSTSRFHGDETDYLVTVGVYLDCDYIKLFEDIKFNTFSVLSGVFHFIPSDYLIKEKPDPFWEESINEEEKFLRFDYMSLYRENKFFKDSVDYLVNRLLRLYPVGLVGRSYRLPSVMKTHFVTDGYILRSGSFVFDHYRKYSLSYGKWNNEELPHWANFAVDWSSCNLPWAAKLDPCKVGEWTNGEKAAWFGNLPYPLQYRIVELQIGDLFKSFSCGWYKPYRVLLQGVDDESRVRYFFTEEEVYKEIEYLLRIDPINFELDVIGRGYVYE
ncbi:MAG: hypothetical protein GY861_21595 [bacterium]|nr:hypothetical protein [bacterium]